MGCWVDVWVNVGEDVGDDDGYPADRREYWPVRCGFQPLPEPVRHHEF